MTPSFALLLLATLAPSALAQNAYVTNSGSNSVSVIDTQTNRVVGAPIAVGERPDGIAITPDGSTAYVANWGSNSVSVIDTHTNRVVGSIPVSTHPFMVAITPEGRTAYVTSDTENWNGVRLLEDNVVSVIDTRTNNVVGTIRGGFSESFIAITPDGRTAYVTGWTEGYVGAISTETNQVVGMLKAGGHAATIAISPDGTAYVAVPLAPPAWIPAFDTKTNQATGGIYVPNGAPSWITISPDGRMAYITVGEHVFASDLRTNKVVSGPISVGTEPAGIAVTPNSSTAYVANYGSNSVSVIDTETDKVVGAPISVGASPAYIAITPESGSPAYPKVRVKCPARAKPGGCKFKLQAMTRKRTGKAESAVARAKIKAGRSALVLLKPKPAFSAKLGAAGKVLVKETVRINGSKRTLFRRLKVVH